MKTVLQLNKKMIEFEENDLNLIEKLKDDLIEEVSVREFLTNMIIVLLGTNQITRELQVEQIERLEVIMNNMQEINGRQRDFFVLGESIKHKMEYSKDLDLGEDPEFTEYKEEESSPTTDEGGEQIDYGEPLAPTSSVTIQPLRVNHPTLTNLDFFLRPNRYGGLDLCVIGINKL